MNQYQETEQGAFSIGGMVIPADDNNRHYQQMMSEVDGGEAQILPYVAPAPTPMQVRDEALANMVHVFADGRVIQCRDPKFAEDESRMRNAIEQMNRHGVTSMNWYMADDTVAPVTPSELQTAIESGQDQAKQIWDNFFLAIGG